MPTLKNTKAPRISFIAQCTSSSDSYEERTLCLNVITELESTGVGVTLHRAAYFYRSSDSLVQVFGDNRSTAAICELYSLEQGTPSQSNYMQFFRHWPSAAEGPEVGIRSLPRSSTGGEEGGILSLAPTTKVMDKIILCFGDHEETGLVVSFGRGNSGTFRRSPGFQRIAADSTLTELVDIAANVNCKSTVSVPHALCATPIVTPNHGRAPACPDVRSIRALIPFGFLYV